MEHYCINCGGHHKDSKFDPTMDVAINVASPSVNETASDKPSSMPMQMYRWVT